MKEEFLQHVSAGDLEWVTAFVKDMRPGKRSLTDGLEEAIKYKKHDIASLFLRKGAVIHLRQITGDFPVALRSWLGYQ